MTALVSGARVARHFVALVDEDGLRHLVRVGAVLALSDADSDRGATVAYLPGNRAVTVHVSLDEVASWFG